MKLRKLLIGEALPYGVSNLVPVGAEVVVLDDGAEWVQFVVVDFHDPDMEWISDGRVIAVDWAVFERAVDHYGVRVGIIGSVEEFRREVAGLSVEALEEALDNLYDERECVPGNVEADVEDVYELIDIARDALRSRCRDCGAPADPVHLQVGVRLCAQCNADRAEADAEYRAYSQEM